MGLLRRASDRDPWRRVAPPRAFGRLTDPPGPACTRVADQELRGAREAHRDDGGAAMSGPPSSSLTPPCRVRRPRTAASSSTPPAPRQRRHLVRVHQLLDLHGALQARLRLDGQPARVGAEPLHLHPAHGDPADAGAGARLAGASARLDARSLRWGWASDGGPPPCVAQIYLAAFQKDITAFDKVRFTRFVRASPVPGPPVPESPDAHHAHRRRSAPCP